MISVQGFDSNPFLIWRTCARRLRSIHPLVSVVSSPYAFAPNKAEHLKNTPFTELLSFPNLERFSSAAACVLFPST